MRRLGWVAVSVSAALLLAGCGRGAGLPSLGPGRTPAAGFHSVAFHGVSVDVPDAAVLAVAPACGGSLSTSGDLVVPLFDGGVYNCPAHTGAEPSATARPATVLTVVLAEQGSTPGIPLTDPRTTDLDGVTVTAAGPSAAVDAVLASLRATPVDAHGCEARVDPSDLPGSSDGALLPVATTRIAVCEYATTAAATGGGDTPPAQSSWLVASAQLSDAVAQQVTQRVQHGIPADPDTTGASFGPVVRYLVLGRDGTTRTLQTTVNTTPQVVTDGRHTVDVDPLTAGQYAPLPTPFD